MSWPSEVVIDRAAVVVLADGVVESFVRDAEEEVREIVAGEKCGAEIERAVVVGAFEAEGRDGLMWRMSAPNFMVCLPLIQLSVSVYS